MSHKIRDAQEFSYERRAQAAIPYLGIAEFLADAAAIESDSDRVLFRQHFRSYGRQYRQFLDALQADGEQAGLTPADIAFFAGERLGERNADVAFCDVGPAAALGDRMHDFNVATALFFANDSELFARAPDQLAERLHAGAAEAYARRIHQLLGAWRPN